MAPFTVCVSLGQIGLLYDIFGAFILAWGFLIIGPKDFRNATFFYRDKPEAERLGYAKVDAWFGVVLIVLGFLGQLMSTVEAINVWFSSIGYIGPLFTGAVLVLYVACFIFFRGALASRVISRSGVLDYQADK